jgi:NADH-quinone oxidoreductase subunit H
MPEAESELVTGYHTEYSSMKFSMFFIAEYAHIITASALMATLFFGGWDIPIWSGDDAFWFDGMLIRGFAPDGSPIPADPAWWKTLLTLAAFALKTGFFVLLFIWVRWTLPRFRYDQVMHLGWKIMLPTALTYVTVIAGSVLLLDELGVPWGLGYGFLLTLVSLLCTGIFAFVLDKGRIISGAGAVTPSRDRSRSELRSPALGDRLQPLAEVRGD